VAAWRGGLDRRPRFSRMRWRRDPADRAGMPMIWMGQEFGESAPRTQERQPIDWALLQNERNADLRNVYQGLIAMRKNVDALRTDTFDVVHLDAERCIMA